MIKPNDIPAWDIDAAKNFIRKPLSDGFKAWTTLRDRDNVTMTIHELGHLMAWYAAVRAEARMMAQPRLDPPDSLALPAEAQEGNHG